jgi:hypothetical protein
MATKIVTKNSSTASAVPTASDLVQGELAVNVADKKLFTEDNSGAIIELADGVKLAGIEASADVTDTANVTAAGALMDSELTSEASVKALNQGVATTDSPAFAGLTVDTTTLAVDSTNNRVGIGTASPSAPLHVQKGSAGSSAFPSGDWAAKIFNQTDASTEHGLVVANRWQNDSSTAFEVGGLLDNGNGFDTWMKVAGDGKVGIGTTSPQLPLHVKGGFPTAVIERNTGATGAASLVFTNSTTNGTYITGSDTTFTVGNVTDYDGSPSYTERMRIDSSGNVGIGTSSPSSDISSSSTVLEIADSNVASLALNNTTQSTKFEIASLDVSGGALSIRDNNTERMRIDSSGKLVIASAGGSDTGYIRVPVAGSTLGAWTSYAGTASTRIHMRFQSSSGLAGYISTTGLTAFYGTSSDYRLKTDAQPMTGATARLKALKPVNFEWIADGTRVDGFLAHEAQAVVPECVTGEKDAMMEEEYEVSPAVLDEEGNTVEEAVMGTRSVPEYQGIDQSKLVPLLVATIQELEARITQLENN